jgi:hypothetical protein
VISLRRIRTIFRKDLRDAIRDARVLVALLVPLGIGLFYNFTFDSDAGTVKASVAYYSADQTEVPRYLTSVVGDTVELGYTQATSAEQVQQEVRDDRADLGLILPAGFDDAVRRGERPTLQVIQPATDSLASNYVTAAIEPAVRAMAGQAPPAVIQVSNAAEPDESETAIDKIGLRTWSIIVSVVMMIGMISMLAIPVILAEESEKHTLDALVMIASYVEVVIAKAALGVFYIAVMVPLLLGLTRTSPEKMPLFVATVGLLGISLIGAGLLMAGLFKSANQLNTWSGILLGPVLIPAFAIGLPGIPKTLQRVAELIPTGAAMKLLMNSASTEQVFSDNVTAFAIIAAWGVAAFALLLWQLSRRQA